MDSNLYDEFGNYIGPEINDASSGSSSSSDSDGVSSSEVSSEDDHSLDEPEVQPPHDDTEGADGFEQKMVVLEEQDSSTAIVLHEDKVYYKTARQVYGPDVEVLVQEEDTQPLETPIIAPVERKLLAHVERGKKRPATSFSWEYFAGLMDQPTLIRHVAVAGHLHHGKSSLLDMVVHAVQPGTFTARDQGRRVGGQRAGSGNNSVGYTDPLRYTDARYDEQDRKISVKANCYSCVAPTAVGKSYLLNMVDCPGHPNFEAETAAALRLCDGLVLVVDAVEGVMSGTERTLRMAVAAGLRVMVFLNKMDRLILELKLPPTDAYHKITHTLHQINELLAQLGSTQRVSPIAGNVLFGSAAHRWCFTLRSMAKLYADRQRRALREQPQSQPQERTQQRSSQPTKPSAPKFSGGRTWQSHVRRHRDPFDVDGFARCLWGNRYLQADGTFGSSKAKVQSSDEGRPAASVRSFVQFCLEPVYKVYAHVMGLDHTDLGRFLAGEGVLLTRRELRMDVHPLIRLVMRRFLGRLDPMVTALVDQIPSPVEATAEKVRAHYSGSLSSAAAKGMLACESQAPAVLQVAKLVERPDGSGFDALARVMSGVLRPEMSVRVLGEGYTLGNREQQMQGRIGKVWVSQSRYRVEMSRAPAGNLVLVGGISQSILKTATVCEAHLDTEDLCVFRPVRALQAALVKVALEPLKPSELPVMTKALTSLTRSYPAARTLVEDSGEHVLMGTGELHMDCMMHDLRRLFADIEVKVADPVALFCETVTNTSSLMCFSQSSNAQNRLTMLAQPLENAVSRDLDSDLVPLYSVGTDKESKDKEVPEDVGTSLSLDHPQVVRHFRQNYEWDVLAARSIWAFGPTDHAARANVLLDETLTSADTDAAALLAEARPAVVHGFDWAVRKGPLCQEPIRAVKFRLTRAELASEVLRRTRGQLIPTARRVAYSSFLLAQPALMEPVYALEIQTPPDCVEAVGKLLRRRRGNVVRSEPKPGSPLITVHAMVPLMDSYGLETDIRVYTQGQAFVLSYFDHWDLVPGDPLDQSITLRPLEPAPFNALAREFLVKTRRRKGLSEDVTITKFFDQAMLDELANQSAGLEEEKSNEPVKMES